MVGLTDEFHEVFDVRILRFGDNDVRLAVHAGGAVFAKIKIGSISGFDWYVEIFYTHRGDDMDMCRDADRRFSPDGHGTDWTEAVFAAILTEYRKRNES